MKSSLNKPSRLLVSLFFIMLAFSTSCKKTPNPIKYPLGTFPDSVYNLEGLNSAYDDYNTNVYSIGTDLPVIFSSNRGSSGGQFDLVSGTVSYKFYQTSGKFTLSSAMSSDPFYAAIIGKANTAGNDFGPYSMFYSKDSYEYLFLASQPGDNLDLYYEKFLPGNGVNLPVISGPYPVTRLNSSHDDAYLTFNNSMDSVYFCSNRSGNFDIYFQADTGVSSLSTWLDKPFSESYLVDSLNSSGDDKCPFICKNIMVFTSNRDGGLGGYDLYYSVFRNGKWGSPVNFGPGINTAYDEYRPVLVSDDTFTNMFLIFSSNRPGGKGGFDLYFTGYTFPSK